MRRKLPSRNAIVAPLGVKPRDWLMRSLIPCAVWLGAAGAPAMADGLAGRLGAGQSDFGGVGLMQTPTARMAPEGTMSVGWSRTQPYRRYSVFFQPVSWAEGGFRYVEIENREFAAAEDGRNNLDKGFDIKLRLLEETR